MVEVRVWGDFACFTRPEDKVERVSYEVMTPSAARGILEAILWKPEFNWQIREILVLAPIQHFSLVRNEVKVLASARNAKSWQKSGGFCSIEANRTQRHALILKKVDYVIRAQIIPRERCSDPVAKYIDMFERRVRKGQAHYSPYLGTREFTACFAPTDGTEQPIDRTDDLGRMLFDIEYTADGVGPVCFRHHSSQGSTWVRGTARPRFFSARLEKGVLHIPTEMYKGGD